MLDITPANFPAAFKALDKAAASFWACPGPGWQDRFLIAWAYRNVDVRLLAALGDDVGDAHVFAYRKWLDDNTPAGVSFDTPPEWGPWRDLVDACILNRFA